MSAPFADLRRLLEAWEVEITTSGNYATDAWDALTDALLDGTAVVTSLLDVAEAAQAVVDYENAPSRRALSDLRSALARAAADQSTAKTEPGRTTPERARGQAQTKGA